MHPTTTLAMLDHSNDPSCFGWKTSETCILQHPNCVNPSWKAWQGSPSNVSDATSHCGPSFSKSFELEVNPLAMSSKVSLLKAELTKEVGGRSRWPFDDQDNLPRKRNELVRLRLRSSFRSSEIWRSMAKKTAGVHDGQYYIFSVTFPSSVAFSCHLFLFLLSFAVFMTSLGVVQPLHTLWKSAGRFN